MSSLKTTIPSAENYSITSGDTVFFLERLEKYGRLTFEVSHDSVTNTGTAPVVDVVSREADSGSFTKVDNVIGLSIDGTFKAVFHMAGISSRFIGIELIQNDGNAGTITNILVTTSET